MVDPKNGWLSMGIRSALVTFVVTVVAMGCATPDAPNGAAASSTVQTIGDVTVSRDGDDSVVRLAGLIDPIYSVTTPGDENVVVVGGQAKTMPGLSMLEVTADRIFVRPADE